MSLVVDLTDFHSHRPHGPLTANATEPAWNGYLLTVACPCGVVLERWVTPVDAGIELIRSYEWPGSIEELSGPSASPVQKLVSD